MRRKIGTEITSDHVLSLTAVKSGQDQHNKVKQNLICGIKDCINNRFFSLKTDVWKDMSVLVNHTRLDHTNTDYGIEEIVRLSNHFDHQLKSVSESDKSGHHTYSIELAKAELLQLKRLQRKRYLKIKNKAVIWEKLFTYHSDILKNILLQIEVCLCVAQRTVESGFSVVRRLMSDQRTSLSKSSE